jgi:hypothetical protein
MRKGLGILKFASSGIRKPGPPARIRETLMEYQFQLGRRTGVDTRAYIGSRPGSGTWPAGLSTRGVSLTSTAASASSHDVNALLVGSVTQGLEVKREGALYQKHQR